MRPQTARPKPVAKPIQTKGSLFPGLEGDLSGDPIATSIKDRIVVGGTIAESIKEADVKKSGLKLPKQFKLTLKVGKDTIDLCNDAQDAKPVVSKPVSKPETTKVPIKTDKPVKTEPSKPVKSEIAKPSTVKPQVSKPVKK